jgi:hypothetical protein
MTLILKIYKRLQILYLFFFLVLFLSFALLLFPAELATTAIIEPVQTVIKSTWLEQNILPLITALVTIIAAFFGIKVLIKLQGIKLTTLEKEFVKVGGILDEHKKETVPHTSCAIHTLELQTMKKDIDIKVDKLVCDIIQTGIKQRFDAICIEIAEIKESLSLLTEIKSTLGRIENRMEKHL